MLVTGRRGKSEHFYNVLLPLVCDLEIETYMFFLIKKKLMHNVFMVSFKKLE